MSHRPPPKISLRHDWTQEFSSKVDRQPEREVARQAEDSQPTQPNPNPNHDGTERPVVTEQTSRSSVQEIDTRFSRDCKNTNLFVERLEKDKDADENVDADRVRTVRPVVDIDFRVSGLPHAVVKQAENFRVRELVKKIESHPHRQYLQADLQQNNAYYSFSEKSKKMIRDMGNVELFELCETIPKVQCPECLLYWKQGIVYCTCGHFLRENQSSRRIHQWTLDLLSIPNYVIKKGRPHGHSYGKTEEQIQHYIAHNLRKRCIKRGLKEFTAASRKIQHFVTRYSELIELKKYASRWTRDAQKYFTYRMPSDEYFRYKKNWWTSLNTADAMNR